MMKKNWLLVFLCSSMLGVSCSSSGSKQEDKQKQLIDEVMAVHDEVMPKMDTVMTLKSSLDSALKVSSSNDSAKIMALSAALDSADVKMSVWMEEYRPELVKGKNDSTVVKYLENEKIRISLVKEVTNKSIEEATAFLKRR
ncbi:MAG: hypothetical protein QE277_02585 [Flectobacillus sp.]|nr:hypothetical protein [Flectobacillus sp.]